MKYRKLGKTGLDVSILGFGGMRLPVEGGTPETFEEHFNPKRSVDVAETEKMVEYAIDHGINYFDTAYFYHNGTSEVILGNALKPHRKKMILATKLPVMLVKNPSDFEKYLQEQLNRLGTDYLDIYLLHGLGRETWDRAKEMGILGFLDRIKAEGRTRFAGFSFHDHVGVFNEIVDSYHWDLCQIQYNYYDEQYQAGTEGLHYAVAKGIGVVIMEPIRGGRLASAPATVQAVWNKAKNKRTPAEWALRWVWNHPQVSIALSGMNNMAQLIENIKTAEAGEPNALTPEELALFEKAKQAYREVMRVDCTGCGYCMPCPSGVAIPEIFTAYNEQAIFENQEMYQTVYSGMLRPEQRADNCVECGECEEKCPQHIDIREHLKQAHALLYKEGVKPPPFMPDPEG